MNLEITYQSSLAKIFPDRAPAEPPLRSIPAWRGERVHFQAVFRPDFSWGKVRVEADSPLREFIRLRSVELVPVDYLPAERDADCADDRIGLYPDLLRGIPENTFSSVSNQWRSIWVTLALPEDLPAGDYPVTIKFHVHDIVSRQDAVFSGARLILRVMPHKLPAQTLKNSHWFHCDSIARFYDVEIFSEKHWEYIANFMKSAAYCGINMLLTPVITPPLDTEVGGSRPTVQLTEIACDKGVWRFDFSRLERWCRLAQSCGIRYFEAAHLFTQWGANFTPKIMITRDGVRESFGGWDLAADSPEYEDFLGAFLPALAQWIDRHGLRESFYFHCSDEPHAEHCESYGRAFALMSKYLPGMKFFDALSRPEVYEATGRKSIPVICERSLHLFENENLSERWTYYCCEPFSGYPNRFIYMRSWRSRILGALLYRHGMEGFLHWGFNFYFSRLCRFQVNPYISTTAGGAFPAGDAFIVYPGPGGVPEYSLRAEVFYDALQDMRCLQGLEAMYGPEAVHAFLDSCTAGDTLSMADFSVSPEFFPSLRTFSL